MVHYIFGEIRRSQTREDKSPIAPFDVGRSMKLNPENELVREIHAFIGRKVELVRRNLCEAEKKRRAEEEMRKLEKHAASIAKVINDDFDSFRRWSRVPAHGRVWVARPISHKLVVDQMRMSFCSERAARDIASSRGENTE